MDHNFQQANKLFRQGKALESLKLLSVTWRAHPPLRRHLEFNAAMIIRSLPNTVKMEAEVGDIAETMGIRINDPYKDSVFWRHLRSTISPRTDKRAVGIASTPSREKGLKQAMKSLSHQVDEFHIYLNGYPSIPDWMSEFGNATIYRSQALGDVGDCGKFYGLRNTDTTWYFTCDDDIIYPEDYATTLIAAAKQYKCPVGVHGSLLRYPLIGYYERNARHVLHFKWKNHMDRRVHILGTGTMLVDRRQVRHLPPFPYPNMADIWFAKYMAHTGTPLYAIARGDGWLVDADVPHHSIYATNSNENSDQRIIVEREIQNIGMLSMLIKGLRKKVLIGIKTYNRVGYLKECIESICRTACEEEYDIVIAIADDGSTDGTHDYLNHLSVPFELHVIKNQRTYVCGQFNSIIKLGKSLNIDFYFILDDDLFFKKPGWMRCYVEAATASGFGHLCHFNLPHFRQICERTKENFPPDRRRHKEYPLESYSGVDRAMGALFTLTPEIINKVGYADEVNFFVRGGWHGDYSARCCRAGYNETERFWDLLDSNDYLELQNTKAETYQTSISWKSEEFKRASTPEERLRRDHIKRIPTRISVDAEQATSGRFLDGMDILNQQTITVNDVFDMVFVINLDRRKDRMLNIDHRLRRCGISYERFPAVDGSTDEISELYSKYRSTRPQPQPNARMTSKEFYFGAHTDAKRVAHVEACVNGPAIRSAGAMAYNLTYRNILRRCIIEGIERVLILDDDCLFHKDFQTLFSLAHAELPASWKLFQLGTMQYDWHLVEGYSKRLYLPNGVLVASHAVGLHSDTYALLLNGISRMSLPFDIGPLQDCARAFCESSFVCTPNLIIQDQNESDINSSDVAKIEASKTANIYKWDISQYS